MTQLEGATLTNFVAESKFIISQIAALSNLPESEVGLTATQPTSADGIRAANLGLTTRAQSKTDLFGSSVARVAALVKAVETGVNPDAVNITPVWGEIENRSQSMMTDSFVKLVQAGVPISLAGEMSLGLSPADAARLNTPTGTTSEAA